MANKSLFVFIIGALFVATTFAAECVNPEIETTSFTSQDATIVSQIAFIAEFSMKCAVTTKPLFAEVDGRLSPVVRISDTEFQVCFQNPLERTHNINLFRLFLSTGQLDRRN